MEEKRQISPRQPWSIIARRAFPHSEKDPGEVNVDDGLEVRQGHFLGDLAGFPVRGHQETVPDDARGRGHQIEAAKFFYGQVRQTAAIFLLGSVHDQGSYLAAHGLNLGLHPAQALATDIPQHDFAALPDPVFRQFFANASGSPGDHCHCVFYLQHDAFTLSVYKNLNVVKIFEVGRSSPCR